MNNKIIPNPENLEEIGTGMYFKEKVAKNYVEHEQNESHRTTARIIERLALHFLKNIKKPWHIAELGGGAHSDRYENLFNELLKEPKSQIDWVDFSPVMLKFARKYLKGYERRKKVLKFINSDIFNYLKSLQNNKLDLAIMKYTFDHIKDISKLFRLLSKKLKEDGYLIATITASEPILKSHSRSARYNYKGKDIPLGKTIKLKEGDEFNIKFLKKSGEVSKGIIPGAEITKVYYSSKTVKFLAKKMGFEIFLGDWKKYFPKQKYKENLDVLILRKK